MMPVSTHCRFLTCHTKIKDHKAESKTPGADPYLRPVEKDMTQ